MERNSVMLRQYKSNNEQVVSMLHVTADCSFDTLYSTVCVRCICWQDVKMSFCMWPGQQQSLVTFAAAPLQAQAGINQVIDELASTRQEYTKQRDLCAAEMQELDNEQAEYELEQSQMPAPSGIDYAALQVRAGVKHAGLCMQCRHDNAHCSTVVSANLICCNVKESCLPDTHFSVCRHMATSD